MTDIVHGGLFIIGLALFMFGIGLFLSSRKFITNGIKTQATVIENIPTQSRDQSGNAIMYTPLLEYEANGKKMNYTPNTRSNPPAYNIGEKVLIVYSPKNAFHVRMVSFWGIYLGSNILLAMGLPMILLGGGYFLFKWGCI